LGGAREFRRAARLAEIGATCGFELRVSLAGTSLGSRRVNSPDQKGVAYMAFHSVRGRYFDAAQNRLAPLRERRNERNRQITANAVKETGVSLDFDADVLPLSQYHDGGTVTERHILFALAKKLLPEAGDAEQYKLLGKLKAELIPKIFVPATDELMTIEEAVDFAKGIDAILCYPYLGDVTNSPTGDKKAAKYEDDFLEELITFMRDHGVSGITFMPSRNTPEQLERLMALCDKYGLRQISGEDINSPGQSILCEELKNPRFRHLRDETWKLVEREEGDEL
jgi:hypothetical protein